MQKMFWNNKKNNLWWLNNIHKNYPFHRLLDTSSLYKTICYENMNIAKATFTEACIQFSDVIIKKYKLY